MKMALAASFLLGLAILAPAQEPASAANAAAPELAGRLDVNSVMRLVMRAGPFADKIKRGSSGLMVLGMAGLTVNPQLASYDLSQPLAR